MPLKKRENGKQEEIHESAKKSDNYKCKKLINEIQPKENIGNKYALKKVMKERKKINK